jgi:hypothetical protein
MTLKEFALAILSLFAGFAFGVGFQEYRYAKILRTLFGPRPR